MLESIGEYYNLNNDIVTFIKYNEKCNVEDYMLIGINSYTENIADINIKIEKPEELINHINIFEKKKKCINIIGSEKLKKQFILNFYNDFYFSERSTHKIFLHEVSDKIPNGSVEGFNVYIIYNNDDKKKFMNNEFVLFSLKGYFLNRKSFIEIYK